MRPFNKDKKWETVKNKENIVFKDGIGVQGLRFKVVKLSSLIPWDLGHAEQLSFSCFYMLQSDCLLVKMAAPTVHTPDIRVHRAGSQLKK